MAGGKASKKMLVSVEQTREKTVGFACYHVGVVNAGRRECSASLQIEFGMKNLLLYYNLYSGTHPAESVIFLMMMKPLKEIGTAMEPRKSWEM